jgi:hypothetical protein
MWNLDTTKHLGVVVEDYIWEPCEDVLKLTALNRFPRYIRCAIEAEDRG